MKDIRYCISCGLADPTKTTCQLTGLPIDNPQKDFCSKHTYELTKCEWCGTPTLHPIIYSICGEFHTVCHKCSQTGGYCPTCIHSEHCDFEENPINIPKQIQQQIRQGNSIISTVVVNPERIRETCEKNCKCLSKEFGCLRQNCQTCGEWTFRFSKRVKENATPITLRGGI